MHDPTFCTLIGKCRCQRVASPCSYPQGRCVCTPVRPCSGAARNPSLCAALDYRWVCLPTDCPGNPKGQVGKVCRTPSQVCTYGSSPQVSYRCESSGWVEDGIGRLPPSSAAAIGPVPTEAGGSFIKSESQLRIEEARRFTQTAWDLFEKTEHPLAIGALVALMMGLRRQEVLLRQVRDLDDGGRFLWIDGGKTANAKRHLEVPELLRPCLLRLAAGQSPGSLLFGYERTGMPRARATMWAMVRKLCALARVPPVCTHSLRGLYATLAVQSGSASDGVASSLGHGSFEITQRHYAQASSVASASTARVLSILDSSLQGEEQAVALTADLCAHLEGPVLFRLAQLRSQSYESIEAKKLHYAIDPQSIRSPKMEDAQR